MGSPRPGLGDRARQSLRKSHAGPISSVPAARSRGARRPADTHVTLHTSPVWVWPEPGENGGRENLSPSEWDEITAALVTNFRALGSSSDPLRLSLSGGKDSRCALRSPRQPACRTVCRRSRTGPSTAPRSCVRRPSPKQRVSAQTGWPVRDHRRGAGSTCAVDPDAIWRRFRQHAYRLEAIVCPWDGMTDPLRSTSVNVKGFGGNLSRPRRARQALQAQASEDCRSDGRHVRELPPAARPLGVLRKSEAEFQAEWLKAWVHDTVKRIPLPLAPEKFYVDYRLGHWNGPLDSPRPGGST